MKCTNPFAFIVAKLPPYLFSQCPRLGQQKTLTFSEPESVPFQLPQPNLVCYGGGQHRSLQDKGEATGPGQMPSAFSSIRSLLGAQAASLQFLVPYPSIPV